MVIDNNSTDPVKYVDTTLFVHGKGPDRWIAPVTIAHQEMHGPAAYGLNRTLPEPEPEPEPTISYVRCESVDEGALQVIADTGTPTATQVKIGEVIPFIADI